jgi:hypothetical protein
MAARGTITRLWVSPGRGKEMQPRPEVRAVADFGLEGCAHARRRSARQILLVEAEVLARAQLEPGRLKENITTAGILLRDLVPGTLLRLGEEVVLRVTNRCHPCRKLETVRRGLAAALRGQRGLLATVCTGGILRAGDPIAILSGFEVDQPAA